VKIKIKHSTTRLNKIKAIERKTKNKKIKEKICGVL
jgi:hypothetical protein